MTPRTKIISLDVDATDAEVLNALMSSPHARYPVYEENIERVIGYVLAREVYDALLRNNLSIRALTRQVPFFPESTPALDLLRALQSSKQQFGLLVEEQGGLAGLISVEDIAEDLFGEILEEHETPRLTVWNDDADGSVVALGDAPWHEVGRVLGEELHDATSATTISGLLIQRFSGVPKVGDKIMLTPRAEAEVLEASPRQVEKLRLRMAASPDGT